MLNSIKGLVAGAMMSLSKLNQVKENETYVNHLEDETIQEQKVRKQEINVISKKRFYDILNKLEERDRERNKEKYEFMLKQRGINEDFLSFKNIKFAPPLHEQLAGNMDYTYIFKTDNDMYKYASDVHVKDTDGKLTLSFLINLFEHPEIRTIAEDLKNLTAFALNHNGKVYAYDVINFEGIITPNTHEIFMIFESKCIMNGVYPDSVTDEYRTTSKDDLIDPKTYKL